MNIGLDFLKGKDRDKLDEIIVFGSGYYGVQVIYLLNLLGVKVMACFDNDKKKENRNLMNITVCCTPEWIKDVPVVISLRDTNLAEQVRQQCEKLGYINFIYVSFRKLEKYIRELPDKEYLEIRYALLFEGKIPQWDNLRSFNEKLQWLKLYDRNPLYTSLVDKYEVKQYVENKIGKQYVIPTLGVWNHFDEIDFNMLPDQFVLKCTHDSGSVVIVKDRKEFNEKKAKEKLEKGLCHNFYQESREWVYKDVRPRIIAEKFYDDGNDEGLLDYKLMCFDGKVKCSFVCSERYSVDGLKVTFFDNEWNRLQFERHYKQSSKKIPKPHSFDKMISLAEQLSKGIPFVRIDFYEINEIPYFGEYTFYPGGGWEEFTPDDWDYKLGDWLKLPRECVKYE